MPSVVNPSTEWSMRRLAEIRPSWPRAGATPLRPALD